MSTDTEDGRWWPDGTTSSEGNSLAGFSGDGSGVTNVLNRMYTQLFEPANVFFTHAASVRGAQPARDIRYWTHAVIDPDHGRGAACPRRVCSSPAP